jgi:hypothetical protein
MSAAEHDTFVNWVKATLNNGTALFTAPVWLGAGYPSKTCQFIQLGTRLTYGYISPDKVAAGTTLRVYDV